MPKDFGGVIREFEHGELHSGSSRGKVVTNPKQAVAIAMSEQRQLHPAMKAHGQAVKKAHAHLTKHEPGFRNLPGHEQLRRTQQHVRAQQKGY